jgi:hypothetical protein
LESFFIPEITSHLIDKAGEIGLKHKIKGCDAFQLASALEAKTDIFISTDNDLNVAALEHRLFVWNHKTEPLPKIKDIAGWGGQTCLPTISRSIINIRTCLNVLVGNYLTNQEDITASL